ncbi:aldose epimerase family protein [Novosphingobium cyanobacteriorum]|uniref:Aldose 1-epimerase n=1 Tax=Novosphingobium cyanobacteriorum TaxID=3024215 RepID=A0ABT6CH25_9SPHN|nr:aldose epimerase family protein [Novosphingobium cyanobacteriorum]MDF8332783.1 galactose mutarotase [Novosphingobium cyanobacteriorum]
MVVGLALASVTPAAHAAEARQESAGRLADGTEAFAVTLKAANGVSARIISYGATLQSLMAPGRDGTVADVVLGYDDVQTYEARPNYFGVTVGRFANRIAGGRFMLDGKTYQLAQNNNGNSLHGGVKGFDKRNWKIVSVKSGPVASVVLSWTSADGEEGYPGKLDTKVTYSLDERGNLTIAYDAMTDKPTVVNMTNHAIFNMAGEGSPMGAMGHRLTIPASAYTPVTPTLIPTGELRPVAGTVFDFRTGRRVANGLRDGRDQQIAIGRGYDHNFALDKGVTATPQLAARLEDPASGRMLEVLSTEPGVQVYTGNFLDGTVLGKQGHVYRMGDGIALEPQKFPDAPNQPAFVSARVDPGRPYRHVMIYRVSIAPERR